MHNKKEMRAIANAIAPLGSGRVLAYITNHALAARGQQRKGETEMRIKTTNDQDAAASLAAQLASKVYDNLRDDIKMLEAMEGHLAAAFGVTDDGIKDAQALKEAIGFALDKATVLAEDLSEFYKPIFNRLLGRDGKVLHPTVPSKEEE